MKRSGAVRRMYTGDCDKKITVLFHAFYLTFPLTGIVAVDGYEFRCGELLIGAVPPDNRIRVKIFRQGRGVLSQYRPPKSVKVYTVTQSCSEELFLK